jgi:hypothetical protein
MEGCRGSSPSVKNRDRARPVRLENHAQSHLVASHPWAIQGAVLDTRVVNVMDDASHVLPVTLRAGRDDATTNVHATSPQQL